MYRSLIIPVYAPSFLMSACQGGLLMILPLYAMDLGQSEAMAASVLAARGLGNMLADLPAGAATARWGDRLVMQGGIAIMVVATLVAGLFEHPGLLMLCATGIGFAMATWLLARLALVGDLVASRFRGQALSTMAGLQRVGHFIGPALVGLSIESLGYGETFLILASALSLTLVFVNVSQRRQKANATNASKDSAHIIDDFQTRQAGRAEAKLSYPTLALRHRRIWLTAGQVVMLLTLLRSARTLLIPIWGIHLGLSAGEIGLILSLAAGVDMLMFPVAGIVMDHFGRRWSATVCLLLLSAGLALVPLADSTFFFALSAMVAGVGNGLGSGINMTLGTDFAPEQDRGRFLGIWRLIGDSGSLAGPTAIGFLATAWSLKSAMLLVAACGPWAVTLLWLTVPETLQKSTQPSTRVA